MSKGNPITPVRFSPAEREEIKRTIAKLQYTSAYPPWDVSDFIRQAVAEKLAKMHRSRTWRRRKKELRRQREEREAERLEAA